MIEPVGDKISRLRDEKHLTQENIHHNQAQVSKIERWRKPNGISNPDEDTLRICANGLGITFDELIEDTTWVKPESALINKEIAFSPAAFDIEIDDSLNIQWCNRSFPLYNDKGEKNEFCPNSGLKLISECNKCGRRIEKLDQKYCVGCGYLLLEEQFPSGVFNLLSNSPGATKIYEVCEGWIQDLGDELTEYKLLLSLTTTLRNSESPKFTLEYIENKLTQKYRSNNFMEMQKIVFDLAKEDMKPTDGVYTIIAFNKQVCEVAIKRLKQVIKGLILQPDQETDELIEKLQSKIDLNTKFDENNDDEEISEDGNSETAAENNNAENKDDKESNND